MGSLVLLDTVEISLIPSIEFDQAIIIAKQRMDFSNSCITYRLGIFDINYDGDTKDLKLSWKVSTDIGLPHIIMDANSGKIYYQDDGLRI